MIPTRHLLEPGGGLCYIACMTWETVWEHLQTGWVAFILILAAGWVVSRLVKRVVHPLLSKLPPLPANILQKGISLLICSLAGVQALHAVGVDIVSILGAAGVAGVAIGFAAQTTLSNLISGIFIMSERSIKPGDYIHVGGFEGTVEAINMLSVTIRQPDNSLLRVPCETIIKTPMSNESQAGMRRCSITVGVEYGTDLDKLQAVAFGVVEAAPYLLDSPAPVLRFVGFDDSCVSIQICAWCQGTDYYGTRYRFAKELYEAFNAAGIGFAFPVRTVVQKG